MNKPMLQILSEEYTVHRFEPTAAIPLGLFTETFLWVAKTDEELSIICNSTISLQSEKRETGWSAIKIVGPIAFSTTGIISGVSSVLASVGISVFIISTYDTDYILVKKENLEASVEALKLSNYSFVE